MPTTTKNNTVGSHQVVPKFLLMQPEDKFTMMPPKCLVDTGPHGPDMRHAFEGLASQQMLGYGNVGAHGGYQGNRAFSGHMHGGYADGYGCPGQVPPRQLAICDRPAPAAASMGPPAHATAAGAAPPSSASSASPGNALGAAIQEETVPASEKEEKPKEKEPVKEPVPPVPIKNLADEWSDLVGNGKKKKKGGGKGKAKAKAKGKAKSKAKGAANATAKATPKAEAVAASTTNKGKAAVLKRPAAHLTSNLKLPYPGVPTKINKPVHVDGWKIYTSLSSTSWRVYEEGNKIDKRFCWGVDGSLGPTAWKNLCEYIAEGSK